MLCSWVNSLPVSGSPWHCNWFTQHCSVSMDTATHKHCWVDTVQKQQSHDHKRPVDKLQLDETQSALETSSYNELYLLQNKLNLCSFYLHINLSPVACPQSPPCWRRWRNAAWTTCFPQKQRVSEAPCPECTALGMSGGFSDAVQDQRWESLL